MGVVFLRDCNTHLHGTLNVVDLWSKARWVWSISLGEPSLANLGGISIWKRRTQRKNFREAITQIFSSKEM
jgi:hypothetical protein